MDEPREVSLVRRGLRYLRTLLAPKTAKRAVLRHLPTVLHAGNRALCRRVSFRGRPHLKKTFQANEVGLACYERELLAREVFKRCPWIAPVVHSGQGTLITPLYPQEARLDRVSDKLDDDARLGIAKQAVGILFEIFMEGLAHRDFHAGNLFLVDGRLIVTDFEVMEPYPHGGRPAFPICYDLTGTGLESPFETKNMCYVADDPYKKSLKNVLRVPLEKVLREVEKDLKDELRAASTTFRTRRGRHTCRTERVYGSFALPFLAVLKTEAQRDCTRRLENFRLQGPALRGKSVLDLGCNAGGLLFEAQRLQPGRCLGVEYDVAKVELARKVAGYNGLNNVEFVTANVDKMSAETLGGPFDVVFCLALEAHVKRADRLYRLLAEVTREALYFEGNSTTDMAGVESRLGACGFARVERLGVSDDDCVPENNCRPLLVANK